MSITEQAKSEMERAKFPADEQAAMLKIMEIFFEHWDSGGAVAVMAPVLQRLLAGKPISPLTGADDEWFRPMDDVECWQNVRCGTVFKERRRTGGWITYDIDRAPLPDGKFNPDHHRWAAYEITFPYMPEKAVARGWHCLRASGRWGFLMVHSAQEHGHIHGEAPGNDLE